MSIADQTFQESVQALANWRQFLALKKEEYIRQLERARIAVQEGAPTGSPEEPEQTPTPNPAEPTISEPVPPPAPELETWEVVTIPDPAPGMDPGLSAWDIPSEPQTALPDEADIFQLDEPLASPALVTNVGGNGHDLAPPSENPAPADLGITSSGLPWSAKPEPPAADLPPEDQGLPDWL